MDRYFFDLRKDNEFSPDNTGLELRSIEDVRNEAAYALADLLRDQVRATMGSPDASQLTIEVRDSHGIVLEAKFSFEIKRHN